MIEEKKFEEALRLLQMSDRKRSDICRSLGIDYKAFSYFLQTRHPELISHQSRRKHSVAAEAARKDTARNYRKALALYEKTNLSYKEIADKTGVSLSGFKTYVQKRKRDLLLKRYGFEVSKRWADTIRLRKQESAQSLPAYIKYTEAIEACKDPDLIELTVSDIARSFNLAPNGLWAQLRDHFPEVVAERDKIRRASGIVDNRPRGMREVSKGQYEEAVRILRETDKSIMEVAEETGVTYAGLRSHLLTYHKDVVALRRERLTEKQKAGWRIEKGGVEIASKDSGSRYDRAIERLKNGEGNVESVAREEGFVAESLRTHLKKYHPEIFARYGRKKIKEGKAVLARSAEKYEAAIKDLIETGLSKKEAAEKHGLVYNSFTSYLRRNHPEL